MISKKSIYFIIAFILMSFIARNIIAGADYLDIEKKAKEDITRFENEKQNAKKNVEIAYYDFLLAERYLLYPHRNIDKAVKLLEEISEIDPKGKYGDDALFFLGYIFRKEKKDAENSLKYFKLLLEKYSNGADNTEYFYDDIYSTRNKKTWNDDAEYQIGIINRFMLKDTNAAIENFQKLLINYPKSPFANDALYEMALIYEENQDWEKAYELYQRICEEYPFGTADLYLRGTMSASLLAKQKIEALHLQHNTPPFTLKNSSFINPDTELECKLLTKEAIPEGENVKILFEITNKSSYPIILSSVYSVEKDSTPSFWSRWGSTEYTVTWINTRAGDLRYNEGEKRMDEFPVLKQLTPDWYPYASGLLLPGQSKSFSLKQYIQNENPIKIKLIYLPVSFSRLSEATVSLSIYKKIPNFTAGFNVSGAVSYGHPIAEELEQGRHGILIFTIGGLPDFSEYEYSFTVKTKAQEFSLSKAIEAIGGTRPDNFLYSKKSNAWILSSDNNLWIVTKNTVDKLSNISFHVFEYIENNSFKPMLFIKGDTPNINKHPLIKKLTSVYKSEIKENFIIISLKDEDVLEVIKELNKNELRITVDSWYLNPILLVSE